MTIIKKTFLCMLLFSLSNCGYEPLYSKKGTFIDLIQGVQEEGNKSINRKIISTLNLKNLKRTTGYKLKINSSKIIETVSKDTASNTSIYKTIVTVKIYLIDGDKIHKEKIFNESFTYNNMNNKFNLSQYQREIEVNLINKIIDQILIFLII